MLIKKPEYPERSDLVICTVIKIQFNSIFVRLDEYQRKQGIIHISEISPGRIRNIRDFVKEGKVIVCVVLRVNRERDLIELSLRRVTDAQRRNKINGMKLEQKAEKIIEFVAKAKNTDAAKLSEAIIGKLTDDYDSIHSFFENVVAGTENLSSLGLPEPVEHALLETITQRIKPPQVVIKARFVLKSFQPNGIDIIRQGLLSVAEIGGESATITYQGAGKYDVTVIAEDYKSAEKLLDKMKTHLEEFMRSKKSLFEFARLD